MPAVLYEVCSLRIEFKSMQLFTIMAISLSVVSLEAVAQKKVTSGSFNTLLKMMLKHNVKEITVPEVTTRKNAIFLDAREKKEYVVSHIKNAVYVGYDNFDLSAVKNVSKGAEIIVYCSIGKRSEEITQKLNKAGYSNVSNLYGGIFEWVNLQNEVVDMNNKRTTKVHAYGRFWGQWLDKGQKVYN
jgi:rhodanese-related sulfurtransferase